jgi:hypothetical protein
MPQFTHVSDADNILFNLPLDEERYQKTLEVRYIQSTSWICLWLFQACALVSDLEILEDGDNSEIGERGVCKIIQSHCADAHDP